MTSATPRKLAKVVATARSLHELKRSSQGCQCGASGSPKARPATAWLPLLKGLAAWANTDKAGAVRGGQVFAYGQTGSGKTHTMGTAATFRQMSSGEEGDGIIPRSMRYIFDCLTAVQDAYDVSLKARTVLPNP